MNIYAYGGLTRETATTPITESNAALEEGKSYSIDAQKGIFLIAYPNEGKETDFEFTYKMGIYEEKTGMGAGIIVAVVLFICAILIMLATIRYRMKQPKGAGSG